MTAIRRPANAVWCTCPKGWHLSFVAQQRCRQRPNSPGVKAAAEANLKVKSRKKVR